MEPMSHWKGRQPQESVWDYPRPPRVEKIEDRLRVDFAGEEIADTEHGFRVLETSHPPVYYLPPSDVRYDLLVRAPGESFCEFKGIAAYWSLEVYGNASPKAAWSYPAPTKLFSEIAEYFAFYPSRVDACWVGEERVVPQAGDFYGGWITSRIVGPFKGGPGTRGW
ncbi:MAG: hypothetical protein CL573_01250 [Alphaproteobacteria bacterium]|nr:hypothetical protein [Alphaproteobacteria bacterium]